MALIQIRNSDGELRGRAFAWFGIVTSLLTLTFYAMYFRTIPGLGWCHERVMTNDICGVPFSLGKPIADCNDGPPSFHGEGYAAMAYRIPQSVIHSPRFQTHVIPRIVGNTSDWNSVAWRSPVGDSDLQYVNFVFGNDEVREVALNAIKMPSTRIAYFYKTDSVADRGEQITDVRMYLIDIENRILIIADRFT